MYQIATGVTFYQRGETTNQLKWLCVWQFSNCGPMIQPIRFLVCSLGTRLSTRREKGSGKIAHTAIGSQQKFRSMGFQQ